jgi:hypothetical protein
MARTFGLVLVLLIGVGGASCGDSGPLPTGAPCGVGSHCKSGHCISTGTKAACTGPCTTNADCPPGAPSCETLPAGDPFVWAEGQMWCIIPEPLTP